MRRAACAVAACLVVGCGHTVTESTAASSSGGSVVSTGGVGGSGGTGGQVTTAGSGGTGGEACEPEQCAPKSCGIAHDGCGMVQNCGGCGQQGGPSLVDGPMICDESIHACVCKPEGGSPEAMAMCGGTNTDPTITEWCAGGTCSPMLCGIPPVPKSPDDLCKYGGPIKVNAQDPESWIHVWCCH